jgi:hypothetical protein
MITDDGGAPRQTAEQGKRGTSQQVPTTEAHGDDQKTVAIAGNAKSFARFAKKRAIPQFSPFSMSAPDGEPCPRSGRHFPAGPNVSTICGEAFAGAGGPINQRSIRTAEQ